jgi:uncharacterized protein (TIGR03435 family)
MGIMTTSLLRIARPVAYITPLVIAALRVSAQSQSSAVSPPATQPSLRFEVASIRAHQSAGDEPSNRQVLPGGRFVATATNVRTFVRVALGSDAISVPSAANWIDSETFDIIATTANHTEVTTPQQFQQLILSLLEDRFQFKFHRQGKEAAVYWLELNKPGKLGPALKQSGPASESNMSTNSNGSKVAMKISKMSMADIAAALRRQAGRPVEDHTDLKGNFDFQIEWARDETADSADPSLFTVLKEQLGLKLQSAKGVTETFVVDQIAHPSAN